MSISRCAALVLLLSACVNERVQPPPYPVYLEESVHEADRAIWEAAVGAWNAQAGREVLYLVDEAPDGGCVARVRLVEHVGFGLGGHHVPQGDCSSDILYEAGDTVWYAAHELGHRLGLDDSSERGSVMCDMEMPSPADGEAVRELWGME